MQEQIMFTGCQKQVPLFGRFNYIILGRLNYQIVESYYVIIETFKIASNFIFWFDIKIYHWDSLYGSKENT